MTTALDTSQKNHLVRQATIASVAVSLLIIGAKIVAWLLTGSVSLLASLVDSILDVVVSVINFLAVRYAMQPPDKEHRFGHGKAEDLAAFAQASFITVSGIFVAFQAIKHFFIPSPPEHTTIGIGIMLFSTLLAALLVCYQSRIIKKTRSPVIRADKLHYANDILINGAVIISLLCAKFLSITWLDPLFALAISIYIIMGAWDIGVKSFHDLMDREFNDEERSRIKAIITSHPSIRGWHRLKTRSSGGKPFIQFDVELDGNISLREAHTISDEIEKALMKEFPEAEVVIHQDPV